MVLSHSQTLALAMVLGARSPPPPARRQEADVHSPEVKLTADASAVRWCAGSLLVVFGGRFKSMFYIDFGTHIYIYTRVYIYMCICMHM